MREQITYSSLDLEQSIDYSFRLAQSIAHIGFTPDVVVGVANGGTLPAQVVSQFFDCPLLVIGVARPLSRVKRYLPLNAVPRTVKLYLRQLEVLLGLYKHLDGRRICSTHNGNLAPGKYVIVDDSLDTGNTMRAVVDYLETNGIKLKDIRIAVLTQIFEDASPTPDCKIFHRTNISFPWSMDSPDHTRFLEYCASSGIHVT